MNYEECLSYLFDQLPVFQRIGAAAYRKDLRNTLALASAYDNPEQGLKCVHIAGTNGKGSTAHALAAIFQACGYRTGLMTSPHYVDFRERIKVDGQMIQKDYVQDWISAFRKKKLGIEPSFFELTVIMGFCYFKEKEVDIAIIETGMGGRLDSTNIVSPELSVITSIAMDHTAFLGDTLEAIAMEKAGIIKQDVPVVISCENEAVLPLLSSVAESRNAPLHFATFPINHIHTDLRGAYQQYNMSTVLKSVEVLKTLPWELPDTKVVEGLNNVHGLTGLLGRYQTISKKPHIIADSAHNPNGITAVLDGLKDESYSQLHIVIGMVHDKDIDAVLTLLPLGATYYFCQAKVMRALACDMLAQQGLRLGLVGECYGSVKAAIAAAKDAAGARDLILITGSVFTVAEAL